MTEGIDPVTIALTGHLPFHLILAALLTWPIAVGLLSLYKRAVRRSMRTSASPADRNQNSQITAIDDGAQTAPTSSAELYDLPVPQMTDQARAFLGRLTGAPRSAAAVYAAGGAAYTVVMASAELLADGLEFRPLRFLFLFWVAIWPAVLTVSIVAAATRRSRAMLTAGYFVCLFAIGGAAMPFSPDLTWGQVALSWALSDLPPTILIAAYLSRGVRAVGPLVLIFMLLALIGSDLAVLVVGSDERLLRAVLDLTGPIGLGGHGTFVALLLCGFLIFAGLGWITLAWIRRWYQAKQISDETVTIDAIWIMFTIAHSVSLVFGHPLWALGGPVAFVAYKVCVRAGLKWVGRRDGLDSQSRSLLVLRSFSIGRDGERLFDVIDRFWRRVGSIDLIAGIDLAHRTVEPHEFLDFISGRISRRFIDGPEVMEQRMRERDVRPDQDCRFRVNDFFCYDDTWKMVLSRLVRENQAVLMDLRGFTRNNAGCVFELKELARMVPLERVVFVIDRRTDENLLVQTLGKCRAGVYRLDTLSGRHIRQLMQALAMAATPLHHNSPASMETVC